MHNAQSAVKFYGSRRSIIVGILGILLSGCLKDTPGLPPISPPNPEPIVMVPESRTVKWMGHAPCSLRYHIFRQQGDHWVMIGNTTVSEYKFTEIPEGQSVYMIGGECADGSIMLRRGEGIFLQSGERVIRLEPSP